MYIYKLHKKYKYIREHYIYIERIINIANDIYISSSQDICIDKHLFSIGGFVFFSFLQTICNIHTQAIMTIFYICMYICKYMLLMFMSVLCIIYI